MRLKKDPDKVAQYIATYAMMFYADFITVILCLLIYHFVLGGQSKALLLVIGRSATILLLPLFVRYLYELKLVKQQMVFLINNRVVAFHRKSSTRVIAYTIQIVRISMINSIRIRVIGLILKEKIRIPNKSIMNEKELEQYLVKQCKGKYVSIDGIDDTWNATMHVRIMRTLQNEDEAKLLENILTDNRIE